MCDRCCRIVYRFCRLVSVSFLFLRYHSSTELAFKFLDRDEEDILLSSTFIDMMDKRHQY
jgi:hypothetical protein